MATQLTLYLPGQDITDVSIDTGFSGTPGVDPPQNSWKVGGRDSLTVRNNHGSQDVRYKIDGYGKFDGEIHPLPFYGKGTGGLDTYLLSAGGSRHQLLITYVDRFRDPATGNAAISFYDENEDPLDLSLVGTSVRIYCVQFLNLP